MILIFVYIVILFSVFVFFFFIFVFVLLLFFYFSFYFGLYKIVLNASDRLSKHISNIKWLNKLIDKFMKNYLKKTLWLCTCQLKNLFIVLQYLVTCTKNTFKWMYQGYDSRKRICWKIFENVFFLITTYEK